jgi:hypothetical protein
VSRARARSAAGRLGRAALLAAAASLAACEDGLPFREPLEVVGLSGGRVAMTNTSWRACTDDGAGGSESYREVHGEEGAVTFLFSDWAAPGCTGAEAPIPASSAYAEAHGDKAVGWAGGPPPDLPETVTATRVLLDGWFPDVYLVDDRAAPRVLYTGNTAAGAPRDRDGWPEELQPVQEIEE